MQSANLRLADLVWQLNKDIDQMRNSGCFRQEKPLISGQSQEAEGGYRGRLWDAQYTTMMPTTHVDSCIGPEGNARNMMNSQLRIYLKSTARSGLVLLTTARQSTTAHACAVPETLVGEKAHGILTRMEEAGCLQVVYLENQAKGRT